MPGSDGPASQPTKTSNVTGEDDKQEQQSPLETETTTTTTTTTNDKLQTARFHYLIPASNTNRRLCFALVSGAVNRYPVPSLVGWNATGLLSAATTHLAKLHAIQRYLDRLSPDEDEDLVLIVDGYDVVMQLPPDVMIRRYFQVRDAEDSRNAKRFGLSVPQLKARGLATTLFFGADKICWPVDWRAPRCWAVPESPMPGKAFGDKTNNGDMNYLIPRWLNSGTLMGPAADMREYVAATLYEILNSYDEKYAHSESDQFYLANVWGRQEYFRSRRLLEDGDGKKDVEGGPSDRELPRVYDRTEPVEFHVGVDYESVLFQTKAGYEQWNDWVSYDSSLAAGPEDLPSTTVDRDLKDEGPSFQPYTIPLPADVESSLRALYASISGPSADTSTWIRRVKLGTNFITRQVWGLWHVTGDKTPLEDQFTKFWFYPHARSLLKAGVEAMQTADVISETAIGGKRWVHKSTYPERGELRDELGGAWSDEDGGRWLDFGSLCKEWEGDVLGGEKVKVGGKGAAVTDVPPPPERHS